MSDLPDRDVLEMTTKVVAAFVANNVVPASDLAALLKAVHATLNDLSAETASDLNVPQPAVPIEESIQDDYLVCLEDGRQLKMLKRYLRSRYDMTPEEYREKWGLPTDYPMVAPNYAKLRSKHAKKIGLGKKNT